MRSITRWDPFAEFTGLRRAMDRAFVGPTIRTFYRPDTTDLTFPIDLYETGDSVVVRAVLPGMTPDDVDISVDDGNLTIKGETTRDEETKDDGWFRREIRYGSFSRVIPLPARVSHDKADAQFKDGVLNITLPKTEEAVSKTIKATAA